ncbi:proteasome activator pa28, REG alpha/beta subunit [Auriscalpium vulgare]|uniref:Proteasome activator pa28, REG alpha/beta subunit n=1 Tax=Auriscalpium vulgare TaxID=40419 RepID=A0ACB8SC37_9AGAM|nr:proteasome activator pa28, REG alpha/beta subunit [Auriscalpium vulgare]
MQSEPHQPLGAEGVDDFEDFSNCVIREGQDILFRAVPQKLIALQRLIDSMGSTSSPFHSSAAPIGTDTTVYPPPEGSALVDLGRDNVNAGPRYTNVMLAHRASVPVLDIVRQECEQMEEYFSKVLLWFYLTRPDIDEFNTDKDDYSDGPRGSAPRCAESGMNLVARWRSEATDPYLERAKICSKLLKYPHLEDYAMALREFDVKELLGARHVLFTMRDHYAALAGLGRKYMKQLQDRKPCHESV